MDCALDKLWLWFPVGPAGIRTLLLYICSLSVFVLRVAQLHLGSRTTASPFQTFTQRLLDFNTIQTFGWYGFSTWWFSEVYMWSASSDANLNWISEGKWVSAVRERGIASDVSLDRTSAPDLTKGLSTCGVFSICLQPHNPSCTFTTTMTRSLFQT